MVSWLRRQWGDIKGNVKYAFMAGVILHFGPSMLATLLSLYARLHGHKDLAELAGIPATYWLVQTLVMWSKSKGKRPKVKLTPHCQNDTEVYLEVLNQGKPSKFSAQLRVIDTSDRQFKSYPFTGRWRQSWPPRSDPEYTETLIETGKAGLLRIATVSPHSGYGTSTIQPVGLDQLITWDASPTGRNAASLPYFKIRISLFAQNHSDPVIHTFRVGPKTYLGPTEVLEVL